MNRRNAVIRVLATIAAAIVGPKVIAQEPGDITGSSNVLSTAGITFNRHQSLMLSLDDESDKGGSGITHISVEYQGRKIILSAKEIMEALEG